MLYKLIQSIDTETEKDIFKQTVDITIIEKDNRTFFKYLEQLEDDTLKVILSIEGHTIRIMRNGIINMKFTFIENETTDTVYDTPAGRHRFNIYTTYINITDNEIDIKYKLYENNQLMGTYQYYLEKEEKNGLKG